MKLNRVAITGISAISGVGNNLDSFWSNLIAGKSGISAIENVDEKMWPIRLAGVVKNFIISDDILDAKEQPRFDTFIHYALHCSDEALKQSGLLEDAFDPYKVGSIMGVGLGGFPFIENTHQTYLEKGPRRISPFLFHLSFLIWPQAKLL